MPLCGRPWWLQYPFWPSTRPAHPATFHGLDPGILEKTVNPSNDLYTFAEGDWLSANPVPPEFSRWGSFNELIEKNLQNLRSVVNDEDRTGSVSGSAAVQKVRDFYSRVVDSEAAERDGTKPLAAEFERIAQM